MLHQVCSYHNEAFLVAILIENWVENPVIEKSPTNLEDLARVIFRISTRVNYESDGVPLPGHFYGRVELDLHECLVDQLYHAHVIV